MDSDSQNKETITARLRLKERSISSTRNKGAHKSFRTKIKQSSESASDNIKTCPAERKETNSKHRKQKHSFESEDFQVKSNRGLKNSSLKCCFGFSENLRECIPKQLKNTIVLCPVCGRSLKGKKELKTHLKSCAHANYLNKEAEYEDIKERKLQPSKQKRLIMSSDVKERKLQSSKQTRLIMSSKYKSRQVLPDVLEDEEEDKIKSRTCIVCSKVFARSANVALHMRLHRGERPFPCTTCGKRFRRSDHLKNHELIHIKKSPYRCTSCSETFKRKDHLKYHKINSHGGNIYLNELKSYIRVAKSEPQNKANLCDICGISFTSERSLKNHVRIHSNQGKYSCPHCQKVFNQSSNLNIHLRKHTGVTPYKCFHCDKAFATSSKLKTHARKHTGDLPYSCETCGRLFGESHLLKMHMKIHTDQKPYTCSHCGKTFTHGSTLRAHIRTHTGAKPYKCDICGDAFAQISSLTYHKRSHAGEKPYSCHICGNSYTRMATLNVHLTTHTGQKRVSCPSCNFMCNTLKQLRRHVAKSHSNLSHSPDSLHIQGFHQTSNMPHSEGFITIPTITKNFVSTQIEIPQNQYTSKSYEQIQGVSTKKNNQDFITHEDTPPHSSSSCSSVTPINVNQGTVLNSSTSYINHGHPSATAKPKIHSLSSNISAYDRTSTKQVNNQRCIINEDTPPHSSSSCSPATPSKNVNQGIVNSSTSYISNSKPSATIDAPSSKLSGYDRTSTKQNNQGLITHEVKPPHSSSTCSLTTPSNVNQGTFLNSATSNINHNKPSALVKPNIHTPSSTISAYGLPRFPHVQRYADSSSLTLAPDITQQQNTLPTSYASMHGNPKPNLPTSPSILGDATITFQSRLVPKVETPSSSLEQVWSGTKDAREELDTNQDLSVHPRVSYSASNMSQVHNYSVLHFSDSHNDGFSQKVQNSLPRESITQGKKKNLHNEITTQNLQNSLPRESITKGKQKNLHRESITHNLQNNLRRESITQNSIHIENVTEGKHNNLHNESTMQNLQNSPHRESITQGKHNSLHKEIITQSTQSSLHKENITEDIQYNILNENIQIIHNSLHNVSTTHYLQNSLDRENFTQDKYKKHQHNERADTSRNIQNNPHTDATTSITESHTDAAFSTHYATANCSIQFTEHNQGRKINWKESTNIKQTFCEEVHADNLGKDDNEAVKDETVSLEDNDSGNPRFQMKSRHPTNISKEAINSCEFNTKPHKKHLHLTKNSKVVQSKTEAIDSKQSNCSLSKLKSPKIAKRMNKLKMKKVQPISGQHSTKLDETTKLTKVMRGKAKKGSVGCNICGHIFSRAGNLKTHLRLHSGERPYSCNICNRRYTRSDHLKTHMKLHNGDTSLICNHCGELFGDIDQLNKHMDNKHEGRNPFSCGICSFSSIHLQELRSHIKDHEGKQSFECDICDMSFIKVKDLKKHVKSHNMQIPFKCQTCGKAFKESSCLKLHLMTKHTGQKHFRCGVCDEKYVTAAKLQRHMRNHNGARPYACEFCGKMFIDTCLLKMHARIHTKEKPFKCTHCGQNFTHKSTLRAHVRIHTGNKPYRCDTCGASFAQISSLNYHKRRHDGLKPYTCHVCGNSYTRSTTLNIHMTRHTGQKQVSCPHCVFKFDTQKHLHKHLAKFHNSVEPGSAQVDNIGQHGEVTNTEALQRDQQQLNGDALSVNPCIDQHSKLQMQQPLLHHQQLQQQHGEDINTGKLQICHQADHRLLNGDALSVNPHIDQHNQLQMQQPLRLEQQLQHQQHGKVINTEKLQRDHQQLTGDTLSVKNHNRFQIQLPLQPQEQLQYQQHEEVTTTEKQQACQQTDQRQLNRDTLSGNPCIVHLQMHQPLLPLQQHGEGINTEKLQICRQTDLQQLNGDASSVNLCIDQHSKLQQQLLPQQQRQYQQHGEVIHAEKLQICQQTDHHQLSGKALSVNLHTDKHSKLQVQQPLLPQQQLQQHGEVINTEKLQICQQTDLQRLNRNTCTLSVNSHIAQYNQLQMHQPLLPQQQLQLPPQQILLLLQPQEIKAVEPPQHHFIISHHQENKAHMAIHQLQPVASLTHHYQQTIGASSDMLPPLEDSAEFAEKCVKFPVQGCASHMY